MHFIAFDLFSFSPPEMESNTISIISLKYKESILRYLDKSGNLLGIKEVVENYKAKIKKIHNYQMPLLISLEFDLLLLAEISGKSVNN